VRALIRLFGILALVFAPAAAPVDKVAVPPLMARVIDLKARSMGTSTGRAIFLVPMLLLRLMPFRGGRKMQAYTPALWPYTSNFNDQAYRLEG
jgi:hypothetical protein